MAVSSFLLRGLYFGLLLLGAGLSLLHPSWSLSPGVVFAGLVVHAHAWARIIGVMGAAKALLFLQTLPFFGFAVVHLGKLEAVESIGVIAAGAIAAPAILAGECLFVKGSATFTSSAGFILTCCLVGAALAKTPTGIFLGVALVALTGLGYSLARRVG